MRYLLLVVLVGSAAYFFFIRQKLLDHTAPPGEAAPEPAATAATQERVQQNAESVRATAEQRTQRIAAIRAQIAFEERAKLDKPTKTVGARVHQEHLNAQNEKIRLLQLELGKLGVAGAALERR